MSFPLANILQFKKRDTGKVFYSDEVPDGDYIPGANDLIFKSQNISVPNGGGIQTTDWLNATSGLAEGWSIGGSETSTIVTGNGFNGNAQGLTSDSVAILISALFTIESGEAYKLVFKYRHNWSTLGSNVYVRDSGGAATVLAAMAQNTGDAATYESGDFSIIDTQADVYIWFNNEGAGKYFEVDEIRLIKQ